MELLRVKYKQKRLSIGLAQSGLSTKIGVSLGSIKRFESICQISLNLLLKFSLVLERSEGFKNIANIKKSINELTADVNDYIEFYNYRRFHQALNYKKSDGRVPRKCKIEPK